MLAIGTRRPSGGFVTTRLTEPGPSSSNKITEIPADKLCGDVRQPRRREIFFADADGLLAQVRAVNFLHPAQQSAFDQLQAGAAEWVPDDFIFLPTCHSRARVAARRRMGRRRYILQAVGKTRIRARRGRNSTARPRDRCRRPTARPARR